MTTPDNFTIFEGISEIQRMIIGRASPASTCDRADLPKLLRIMIAVRRSLGRL